MALVVWRGQVLVIAIRVAQWHRYPSGPRSSSTGKVIERHGVNIHKYLTHEMNVHAVLAMHNFLLLQLCPSEVKRWH
jgi:hypothetical protein